MGPDMILFNLKKMGKSPTGFRKIFEELSPWLGEALIEVDNRYEAMVLGKAKEMGYTLMTPSPEEMQLWKKAV